MAKILFFDLTIHKLLEDPKYKAGGSTIQIFSWLKGLISINIRVGIFTKNKTDTKNCDQLSMFNDSYGMPKLRWIYYRFPWILKQIRNYHPDFIYQSCAGIETAMAALIAKLLKIPFISKILINKK